MLVLVNDVLFDPCTTQVIIRLNKQDKGNIKNMPDDCNIYAAYPDTISEHERKVLRQRITYLKNVKTLDISTMSKESLEKIKQAWKEQPKGPANIYPIIQENERLNHLNSILQELGSWASAAQDDPNCCNELKAIFLKVLEAVEY